MKNKILTFIAAVSCFYFLSFSFPIYSQTMLITNTSDNTTVTPNSTIALTTTPNANKKLILDIKNTSSQTKSYLVIRYDLILNTGAQAYFCVAGNCYGPGTVISPVALALTPGQSASQIPGSYNMLNTDLDEGPSIGQSIIKYTIRNEIQPSDSIQFVLHYNPPNGISEEISDKFLTIFPTVFQDKIFIRVSNTEIQKITLELYNLLGELVFSSPLNLTNQKTCLITTENIPQGVYFLKIRHHYKFTTQKVIKN